MVRRRTSRRKKRTAYPGLAAAPARSSGPWVAVVLGALVLVNLYVFVWDGKTGVGAIRARAEAQTAMIPSRPLARVPVAAPTPAPPPITGRVVRGDTLGELLERAGLAAPEADEIIRALSGVLDFRKIRVGQRYRIVRGASGRVTHFELDVTRHRRVCADRQASGELLGKSEAR